MEMGGVNGTMFRAVQEFFTAVTVFFGKESIAFYVLAGRDRQKVLSFSTASARVYSNGDVSRD